jgi:Asp-tRNA(Asn)/Glu-tRNA(Gln) amidotransferase B subunit
MLKKEVRVRLEEDEKFISMFRVECFHSEIKDRDNFIITKYYRKLREPQYELYKEEVTPDEVVYLKTVVKPELEEMLAKIAKLEMPKTLLERVADILELTPEQVEKAKIDPKLSKLLNKLEKL